MTRTLIFMFCLATAVAFPAVASANCGTVQGSFSVTCEQGVQVFRHNAPSGIPRGLTPAEASLQAAQLRARNDRLRIESQERANQRDQRLRERELLQDEFRTEIFNRNARRFNNSSFGIGRGFRNGFGGGFRGGFNGSRGLVFGEPFRVRTGSLNIQH